jgi:glycosyltransferase involved in cell wall biosynthesis
MQPFDLSIVVPCYNEEKNIPLILDAFNKLLQINNSVEVILVNNGSTDNSKLVFQNLLANTVSNNIKVIHIDKNKGYGNGILIGLEAATANVLSWTHADMQTNPLDVLKAFDLYKISKNENLLVKGIRQKRNWVDTFFTWGMEKYTNIILQTSLQDINAQPKLFSKAFYNKIKTAAPFDFSLDLYFLLHATKIGSIKSFGVFFTKRMHGEAKGGGTLKGKWKLVKRTLAYIHQLKKTIHK